jgi:hypothetical protein
LTNYCRDYVSDLTVSIKFALLLPYILLEERRTRNKYFSTLTTGFAFIYECQYFNIENVFWEARLFQGRVRVTEPSSEPIALHHARLRVI